MKNETLFLFKLSKAVLTRHYGKKCNFSTAIPVEPEHNGLPRLTETPTTMVQNIERWARLESYFDCEQSISWDTWAAGEDFISPKTEISVPTEPHVLLFCPTDNNYNTKIPNVYKSIPRSYPNYPRDNSSNIAAHFFNGTKSVIWKKISTCSITFQQ